jgi:hypothetical protein
MIEKLQQVVGAGRGAPRRDVNKEERIFPREAAGGSKPPVV